jgi:hypothetical protein
MGVVDVTHDFMALLIPLVALVKELFQGKALL